MAPKVARPAAAVKAKAKAKAKGAPKAAAKGAARRGRLGVRRRPAAQAVHRAHGAPSVKAVDVKLEDVPSGSHLEVEGLYWEAPAKLCGFVTGAKVEGANRYLTLNCQGTKSEALLTWLSGRANRTVDLHLCGDPCGARVWRDGLVHVEKLKHVGGAAEDWRQNLGDPPMEMGLPDDQNEALRREAEEARAHIEGEAKKEKKEKSEKEKKDKKKKKKKDKKKVKAADGKKELTQIYGGTGLDPDPEVRKRALKKAKNLRKPSKKKKKKSSTESSGSTSGTSSTSEELATEVYDGERENYVIWKKAPGTLSLLTLTEAQQHLLTRQGVRPDVQNGQLPPLMMQYYRSSLQPGMSPALSRETMHWCSLIDMMLEGEIARSLDLACQRVKSLESLSKGVQADVARKLELIPPERESLTSQGEYLAAGRQHNEEDKINKKVRTPGRGGDYTPPWKGNNKGNQGKGDPKKGKNDRKGDGKNKTSDDSKKQG